MKVGRMGGGCGPGEGERLDGEEVVAAGMVGEVGRDVEGKEGLVGKDAVSGRVGEGKGTDDGPRSASRSGMTRVGAG